MRNKILTMEQVKRRETFQRVVSHPITQAFAAVAFFAAIAAVPTDEIEASNKINNHQATEESSNVSAEEHDFTSEHLQPSYGLNYSYLPQ